MNTDQCPRVPNFGCHIQMEAPFGKSKCLTCGREWEAMTPQGSQNHCMRELASRLVAIEVAARDLVKSCRSYGPSGDWALDENALEALRKVLG